MLEDFSAPLDKETIVGLYQCGIAIANRQDFKKILFRAGYEGHDVATEALLKLEKSLQRYRESGEVVTNLRGLYSKIVFLQIVQLNRGNSGSPYNYMEAMGAYGNGGAQDDLSDDRGDFGSAVDPTEDRLFLDQILDYFKHGPGNERDLKFRLLVDDGLSQSSAAIQAGLVSPEASISTAKRAAAKANIRIGKALAKITEDPAVPPIGL